MSDRKRLLTLLLVMAGVAVAVASFIIWVLLQAAFNQERTRLAELAGSQARIINSMAEHFASTGMSSEQTSRAILNQLKRSHAAQPGFGASGEFVLGRRDGDKIVFLLPPRFPDRGTREPVPFQSELAEPMRRALKGQSGTLIGPDYGGVSVLAAHEPLAAVNFSIVAKIDVAELRTPFIRAGAIGGGGAVLFILLGGALFLRISNPIAEQLETTEVIRQSEERLRNIFETSPAGIAIILPETNKRLYLNPAMAKLFGASSVEHLMDCDLKQTYANPEDLDWLRSKTGDEFIEEVEIERLRLDGTPWWCLINRRLVEYEGQEALMGWHYDITERKRAEEEIKKLNEGLEQRIEERTLELSREVAERLRAESLQQSRNRVLGRLATGGSLEEILTLLITTAEELNPGMIGSVLLLDDEGKHLLHGAAPSLPEFYNEAIHGLAIGEGVGSCGTAAFTGKTVIVSDVMSHPFWADFRDLMSKAGLKACWSQPILSSDAKVLGTFAMYYRESREPTTDELDFMQGVGNLASIAIERKQAEKTQQRLTQAVEAVPVGIALFDSDDRLVFFNSRYAELMDAMADILKPGVTFEKMIRTIVARQPVKDAIGREEDFIRERIKHHLNPTKPFNIRRDGRWLLADETRLPDGGIFTIITDITDHMQAEEDRGVALVDAERANQAKSEFLATMSHELRTPLNAILGFSDILSHQYFGPPGEGKYREYAADIHASGEHLLELVNDLLDISTIEAGKKSLNKEMLAVNEMVAESFNAISHKAREGGIKLAVNISEDFPPLYADRRATRQIFLNLLTNAVKFTDDGGRITVSAKSSKQKITFKIADTGKGISTDKLPNLTEPFTRGSQDPHRTVDGWGLGLAITKSLVDLHDGTLDIKSTVGEGTTVTVELPNGAG